MRFHFHSLRPILCTKERVSLRAKPSLPYYTRKGGYGNLVALNFDSKEIVIQSVMDEVNFKGI